MSILYQLLKYKAALNPEELVMFQENKSVPLVD